MTPPQVQPIPEGMGGVTPHLVCAGAAAAIEFYKKALNAVELTRMPGPDGKLMHAAIRIGTSVVMLNDENPQWGARGPKLLGGTPVTLHLYTTDVDAFVANAVSAGATVVMPVADMFWGDRYGIIEDPYGHRWSIATHQRDATHEEMREAVKQMCSG